MLFFVVFMFVLFSKQKGRAPLTAHALMAQTNCLLYSRAASVPPISEPTTGTQA